MIPKRKEREYEIFRSRKLSYRLIRKSDANRLRAPVLVVITKGRGKQRRFAGFHEGFADINSVGKTFANLYLLTERKPICVKYANGNVLVEDDI